MSFCVNCGAQLPENTNNCPGCGRPVQSVGGGAAAAPAHASAGGLADNVAGMLAYITIIPAIVFLVVEPYNRNRFIKFHAFQSLFYWIQVAVVMFVMPFVVWIPVLGVLVWSLVCLAEVILWVLLLMKSFNGIIWKLPVIGDIAEKQANA